MKTPGREKIAEDIGEGEIAYKKKGKYDVERILGAIGGKENIESLDNCVTRLRLVVDDMSKVNQPVLKECGALGVVVLDEHNVQVIIGTQVASVKTQLDKLVL